MSVFKYDTLDILDRAEKSASDWWSKTLDNAKKRTDMDQQLFKSAFDNDKLMRTHEGDVFRTGAENVYHGTKANYDTMLEPDRYNRDKSQMGRDTLRSDDESWQLRNAMTPENMDARRVVQNNRFQSPAAALEAGAAAAGIPDVQRAAQVGAMTATYRPGALSTQAEYGRTATQAGALNLANEVAAGNLSGANEALRAGGFGMEVRPGPTPDTVVIVDQNGRQSMPLDRSMAAATIRDRTGTRQGQAGAYLGKVEDQDRRFAQQSQLNTDRIAQRDRQLQFRANTELGKRLADRVKNARTDDERMAAQMDYDEYLNEQGPDTFTPSYGGGAPAAPAASVPFTPASLNPASQAPAGPGVVNPTARAAWSAGMAPAAAPAPAAPAPAAPAAKATAPAQAPAPYTPPAAAQQPPEPPRTINGKNGFPVLNPEWAEWAKATGYQIGKGQTLSELVGAGAPATVNSQYRQAAQNWRR